MKRPLSISNISNIEIDDINLIIKNIFNFNDYKKGQSIVDLKNWFKKYFNINYAFAFYSGRVALFRILSSLNLNKNDEVILQMFTCAVVSEAIVAANLKPIYIDIDNTYNINVNDLKSKITNKTKVIIVQHTFGIPAKIEEIKEIAKKKNIILIEDCAHNIGSRYKNKLLGTFSDIAFFSFGRSKAFSATNGGVVITNNKDLALKLQLQENNLIYPNNLLIFKELLHPLVFYFLINPLYDFLNLGKLILIILQKIKLLSKEISVKERSGKFDFNKIYNMPNIFSKLALNQLEKLGKYNNRREEIVKKYLQNGKILKQVEDDIDFYNSPLLRFPVLVNDPDKIIKDGRKNKIYLEKWYSNGIDPMGVNLDKLKYKKGSCPTGEKISRKVINLPTYPLMKEQDVEKIIKFIDRFI